MAGVVLKGQTDLFSGLSVKQEKSISLFSLCCCYPMLVFESTVDAIITIALFWTITIIAMKLITLVMMIIVIIIDIDNNSNNANVFCKLHLIRIFHYCEL